MAEHSDTGGAHDRTVLVAPQLARAGIRTDGLAVLDDRIVKIVAQIRSVRPDGVAVSPAVLTIAGIHDKHEIDNPVIIVVILTEIYLVIKEGAGLVDHQVGIEVVTAPAVVAPVEAVVIGQSDRAIDIKMRLELAMRLGKEIVIGTAIGLARIVHLIEHTVKPRIVVAALKPPVVELHKDDKPPHLAFVGESRDFVNRLASQALHPLDLLPLGCLHGDTVLKQAFDECLLGVVT